MPNKFPLSKNQTEEIVAKFGTPFYLYDEAGIRKNCQELYQAMSILPNYFEHFAVKALPNPYILEILKAEGLGTDCSSYPELVLSEKVKILNSAIMFTSNETKKFEFEEAFRLGAIVNLDDISHVEIIKEIIKEQDLNIEDLVLSFRYNPGDFNSEKGGDLGNVLIGKPLEAKYGLTKEQLFQGYQELKDFGIKHLGIHTMIASNELDLEKHGLVAQLMFEVTNEIKEQLGIELEFINLGGGVGIPYLPEDPKIVWEDLALLYKGIYDKVFTSNFQPQIRTEYGRPITGPYGWLVARAIRHKNIYRDYIGLDASMADLMRPGLYGAYHHIDVLGKENLPKDHIYDIVGSLCENSDKFAIQRELPKIDDDEEKGDLIIIHDAGAHGRAMGFNYNAKLRPQELLLRTDGSIIQIRRAETIEDYFATLDFSNLK